MFWFGKNWDAPLCATTPHTVTPQCVCIGCDQPFDTEERGVLLPYTGALNSVLAFYVDVNNTPHIAYHLDCFLASLGIIGRLKNKEEGK